MYGIPGTRNIYKHNDRFEIRKKKNGKDIYLAHATTLIIALMKRDWCKANNWDKYPPVEPKHILRTPNGNYMIYKSWRKNGKFIRNTFGTFKTLKEAEREVELLKKCNWDYDLACEVDERRDSETIFLNKSMGVEL